MVEPKTGNLGEKREIWSENQKTQSTHVTRWRETFNPLGTAGLTFQNCDVREVIAREAGYCAGGL